MTREHAPATEPGSSVTPRVADWLTTPLTADLLRGALDLERTEHGLLPHRLPAWARAQCADEQLAWVEAQPSGVRLVFRTRATNEPMKAVLARIGFVPAPIFYEKAIDLSDKAG